MTTYPHIDPAAITLVKRMVKADPSYLSHPDCPYDDTIKGLFASKANVSDLSDLSDDDIEFQITDLYNKLTSFWNEVQFSDKAADKNAFFRVSASLLEKLTDMRKDMKHVKNINSFISEVVAIMEDTLTVDQRNSVMERLQKITGDGFKLGGDTDVE